MIADCNSTNIAKIIDYVKAKQIAFLSIKSIQGDLIMDYTLIDQVSSDTAKNEEVAKRVRNSLQKSLFVIKKLQYLQLLLNNNVKPTFNLLFDCTIDIPTHSYSCILPAYVDVSKLYNAKEEDKVNWNNVFNDRLDKYVPDLFTKRSSKKYIPVTYRELREILVKEMI